MTLSRKVAGLRTLIAAVAGLGALITTAPSAHAYTYSSNNQWASWSSGAYTVFNDVWNPNGGQQWLNIDLYAQFNFLSILAFDNLHLDTCIGLVSGIETAIGCCDDTRRRLNPESINRIIPIAI